MGRVTVLENIFRNHTSDVIWLATVGVTALTATFVLRYVIRTQRDDHPELVTILDKTRRAMVTLVAIAVIRIGMLGVETGREEWARVLAHILNILFIVAVVWFVCEVLIALESILLARYSLAHAADDIRVRKAHTQIILLRRLLVALVITVGVAAALMTFPAVRVLGQGVLASAGLISIVAGLAAQSSLTNIFAGIQLALTDSIRVGDIVEVEQESGTVGEITLTYVVIYLWDDRRLILPSSYFITTPFENWTRRGDRINSVVLIEVDWTVPLDALREEYTKALGESPHWDGRSSSLVVADVSRGIVVLRFTSSAATTGDMFSLNAYVRELVVRFLARQDGAGIPRTRMEPIREGVEDASARL
jgi:small-conductance mechanosensitive channel